MLSSRVMRYEMELRRQEMEEKDWVIECFKCGEKGHKCRKCPLWKEERKLQVVKKAVMGIKEN